MLRLPVRLSAETFAVTWRYAKVGELPDALYVPMPGGEQDDPYASAHAELAAFAELRELAGEDRRGFTADLEGVYQMLAGAQEEYFAWIIGTNGFGVSALLACHGGHAMLAVLDGNTVRISQANPDPGALVTALPAFPPARFRPVSVPSAELFETAPEELTGDVALLREVFATRPIGKGQYYVAVRSPNGRRHIAPSPVNHIDPDPGRVLFYTTDNGGGEYITAKPGSAEAIAEQLLRTREDLVTGAPIPGQAGSPEHPADRR
ncbi:ESX secretion-associated protein EspG [Sciscionella marina]|uniref:ESX secretion-associated protein EspG n=1 Tax=Sciscionella marina TaxID=508770 RepID=UPI0003A98D6C|nr:ESX secretion-associated protein EspG [Sciscionella marina]